MIDPLFWLIYLLIGCLFRYRTRVLDEAFVWTWVSATKIECWRKISSF